MKRIFLAITLIFISLSPVSAQDSKAVATDDAVAANRQLNFAGKVNEIDAVLTRKKTDLAQRLYTELAGMMQKAISENKQKLETGNGEDMARLRPVLDQQNKLYMETKNMVSDMVKNQKPFVAKLKEFSKTL